MRKSRFVVDQKNHINGIENFWNQTSVICVVSTASRHPFYLYLKECEWRFNTLNQNTTNPIDQWLKLI